MPRSAANGILVIFACGLWLQQHCYATHEPDIAQLDNIREQFLPPPFRTTNFTLEDVRRIYRDKCNKVAGDDNEALFEQIEQGVIEMGSCLSNLINITALQAEIEVARPIGEMDTVFHKYCGRSARAEDCVRNFTNILQPCLNQQERKQYQMLLRLSSTLLKFMCTRDGDQIALFVAEDGPECLEANKDAIAQCLNMTFGNYLPQDGSLPDMNSLPELVLSPEHCYDLVRFQNCTVHHLERCREITPANVVDAIFNYIKNETNCRAYISGNGQSVLLQRTSACPAPSPSSILLLTLLLLSTTKFVGSKV